jgi:hypothetical protein
MQSVNVSFSINPSEPSGYYIYHLRFNTLKLCILPAECICVFHMILTMNSYCFQNSINRLVFVAET